MHDVARAPSNNTVGAVGVAKSRRPAAVRAAIKLPGITSTKETEQQNRQTYTAKYLPPTNLCLNYRLAHLTQIITYTKQVSTTERFLANRRRPRVFFEAAEAS